MADNQGMETVGQELNRLMNLGGTLPSILQGKSLSKNYTLNTAFATALIAATQTETASGTNGLLRRIPLDLTDKTKS